MGLVTWLQNLGWAAGTPDITLYDALRLRRRHGTRASIMLGDVQCATISTEGMTQASLALAQIDGAAIIAPQIGIATIINHEMHPLE
jgi:hypothetical protein